LKISVRLVYTYRENMQRASTDDPNICWFWK